MTSDPGQPIGHTPRALVEAANLGAPAELRPLLMRLRMPPDLAHRSVLHIGCGAGDLVAEMARRGAAHAVGLDIDATAIAAARERHQGDGVEFIEGDWSAPPAGPFDLIVWSDSLKRAADPRAVLATLRKRLQPEGVLGLACGVHVGAELQMKYGRTQDRSTYPTMPLLRDMLSGYSVRVTGRPEPPGSTMVEEWAFQCRPRKTTVMLIRSAGNSGKSSLASQLGPAATKVIALDRTVPELRFAHRPGDRLAEFVAAEAQTGNLMRFYQAIDKAGLTDVYIEAVLEQISPSDELVVVEGFMTDAQARRFSERLGGRAFIWDVHRATGPSED